MSTKRALRDVIASASLLAAACSVGEAREDGNGRTVEAVEPRVPREPQIAHDAATPLRAMSEYLAGLDQFSLHSEGTLEVVLEDGQKLSFPYASDVRVRRPARLRSDRVGEQDPLQFFYDGKTFTLFGKRANMYARYPAPTTLDEAIDVARQELDLDAPGADLLHGDPYAVLTEDAVSGFRVGPATIDGAPCQHLAFRGNEVDWQIWIEDGPRPLPRRFVITSKDVEGAPQFVVSLSQWDTSAALVDEDFTFSPPPGAQQIEFLPATTTPPRGTVTQLPVGCETLSGPAYACRGATYRPYYHGTTLVYVPHMPGGKS